MMEIDNKVPVFLAYETIDSVIVQVQGIATYAEAPLLNKFLENSLKRCYKKYCILFNKCEGIDSTCLGVLAGLLLKLRANKGMCLFCGLRPRQLECVQIVGLDKMAYIADDIPSSISSQVKISKPTCYDTVPELSSQLVLDAHKFLIEVCAKNKAHFKDIVLLLEKSSIF